jgi:hypothetical protein
MAKKPKTSETEVETKSTSDDPVVAPATVFPTPPHPSPGIWRVLKQAYREYHGGPGAVLVVTTPATHAAAAVTPVSGTLEVDASCVPMPAAVTVDLIQGGAVKATQSAPTAGGNPATYTTTFPVSVCVAGTATARVSSVVPLKTFTTPAFTLT